MRIRKARPRRSFGDQRRGDLRAQREDFARWFRRAGLRMICAAGVPPFGDLLGKQRPAPYGGDGLLPCGQLTRRSLP